MKMRILIIVAFLLSTLPSEAKIKVVDESARKVPVWVDSAESGYIITSAIESDPNKAKAKCLADIRKQIIMSIAQNVSVQSQSEISQTTMSSGVTYFLDSFSETSSTQSASVPYVGGVSISKVEDFYWQKRQDVKTKEISYLYSIKYPFPKSELRRLVAEFERRDRDVEAQMLRLEGTFESVASVLDVDNAVLELTACVEYFFDDVRRNRASRLLENYRKIYRSITIETISERLGEYVFAFVYNGRHIMIPSAPSVKSETLTKIEVSQKGSTWGVTYSYDTCDPSEINSANISYRIKDQLLKRQFYADVKSSKVQITPSQTAYLTGIKDGSTIKNIELRINLNCDLSSDVHIYQITANVPGLEVPIFVDNIDIVVRGKGMQSVVVTYADPIEVQSGQNGRLNIMTGHLEVYDIDRRMHRVGFSLPFKCNW